MAPSFVKEVLPPLLDASSQPPPLFDGTTRLYIYYACPYARRVWIARNYKGLQDQIKLVGIDLQDRPAWYKEKVYPGNKVPSLEHNGKIIGESLDILNYLELNFGGPPLLPSDPEKQEALEELLSYCEITKTTVYGSLERDPAKEVGTVFDYLETSLGRFNDGPFFMGQFSMVDVAYIPFMDNFHTFLKGVWEYDITSDRPKLAEWFQEMNKIDAYTETRVDAEKIVEYYKDRYLGKK